MEQVTQARDKVLDALVDATDVPLPETVVKAEIDSAIHDAVHPFDHDEAKFEEFLVSQGRTREQFDTETKEAAEKSVRTRLVLDALADREQTTVSAQQYQMQPEDFVRRIQEAGQLGAVYSDVRRSKALIAAVRAATVTDASGNEVDMSDLLGTDEEEGAEATETTETTEVAEDAPPSEEKTAASS
jgi:trigger factor